MENSYVEYFGISPGARNCGYCKKQTPDDPTYGMWAHQLSPDAYQWLIDRNWRRSGKFCYRPINDRLCCPMYTIRCDATKFILRKSHKKVLKKFINFIKNDSRPSGRFGEDAYSALPNTESVCLEDYSNLRDKAQDRAQNFDCTQQESSTCKANKVTQPRSSLNQVAISQRNQGKSNPSVIPGHGAIECGNAYEKINTNKRKYKRRQKLVHKIVKREACSEAEAKQLLAERAAKRQNRKTLEDYLAEASNCSDAKHSFTTKFVSLSADKSKQVLESTFKVYSEYQLNIHKEPTHKVSLSGYKSFLVDSPIQFVDNGIGGSLARSSGLVPFYGSFHQNYYIDGRLIAVGVIDILPGCISSVYLYYDPEFAFLNLGIFSALTEIALVRNFQTHLPNLKHYYMGFYIDSCPKMAYKAKFLPSDLLCSETFQWVPFELCRDKLLVSKGPYARFCDDLTVEDDDGKVEDQQLILFGRSEMLNLVEATSKYSFSHEKQLLIREYGRLIGKKCAAEIMCFRG